ncbi:YoaK family protein [Frateuria defendens]|uniref:YoaK family protein n=1 Tax=Frateuria defendens TaxID=2219559 RepID=UPI00066FCB7E|nr:DUF1275 family protein [Frateuria defendens]
MKPSIPILLSFNAGYVDTAGFMALHGLFTAHVTGNFVTLGAALVLGTSGAVAKLLALPVFCAVVVLARLLRYRLQDAGRPVFRTLLLIKLLLLVVGAALAIRFGPFADGDSWSGLVTGMVLVAAMAVQNAVQRVHLGSAPPTTLMTGTTTQIMLDLGDRLHGVTPEQKAVIDARQFRMIRSVCAFALGCGGAALLLAWVGPWCFAVAPLIALAAYLRELAEPMAGAA